VPKEGQFVAGLVYQESESYHIWAKRTEYSVKWKAGGENYGIDINQGYVTLQYGLTEKFALDLNAGGTTSGGGTSPTRPENKGASDLRLV